MDNRKATKHDPRVLRVENMRDAARLLDELGADPGGAVRMSRKMQHLSVSVEKVQVRAAHIIKETMLSRGGECATPRNLLLLPGEERVRLILSGTIAQFKSALRTLALQPFGLRTVAAEVGALVDRCISGRSPRTVAAGRHLIEVGGRTLVMGIINATPDSLSDRKGEPTFEELCEDARAMAYEGADIIDIGGESTRPGATPVESGTEIERTVPLIEKLAGELDLPISIDTSKADVAERAIAAGASMINDVSALKADERMAGLVAKHGLPVVLMHMPGSPCRMIEPDYGDVVAEVIAWLGERAEFAVSAGIDPHRIIIDPGIGFSKGTRENVEIVRRIEEFHSLGFPVMLGPSRKRFIGELLDGAPVQERTFGTAATVAFAIARGVDIVRVHDVAAISETVRIADALAGKPVPHAANRTGQR